MKDTLGNVIYIGDTIGYPSKNGGLQIKTGIVINIYQSSSMPRIVVKASSNYTSTPVSINRVDRVMVINSTKNKIPREHLSEYGKFIFDRGESGD